MNDDREQAREEYARAVEQLKQLDPKLAAALPAPEALGDEKPKRERGLGRIFRRGERWWIAYYVRSKEVRESAGDTDVAARRKLKKRMKEIHRDDYQGPQEERLTVGDLLDALETHLKNKGAKSGSHKSHVKSVRSFFGMERAVDVNAARIERFIAAQREDQKAAATINREVGILKQAFNLARKQQRLRRMPYFPMLKEDNARQGFFEHSDFQKLLERLPGYLADFSRFGYLTGWRRGEIAALTWDAVDRQAGEVRLRTSKNGHGRLLPLTGELAELIEKRWPAREVKRKDGSTFLTPLVFHRKGKPIGDFRKTWEKACTSTNIGARLFHDFRRTAVRNMVRAGVPQSVAMSISGHRTVSMFLRYNITSTEDQRDALRRTQEHLSRQPETQKVASIARKA